LLVACAIANWHRLSEIKEKVRSKYPSDKEGHIITTANQSNKFRFGFKKEDKVITYNLG